ncbi:uncharacterized protein LAJ45_08666 [Morchella importuna]|uniref:uncharacterized protein n=1 Tax=Morchella importuna TaxID=1174673 RepID=UPI001E8DEE98|nr:uncharacterized protein LAJ45_08666 [Morchella importuna]KAH8147188.1 hypothetical protein LAJ45_08666 [Morchella importuna]
MKASIVFFTIASIALAAPLPQYEGLGEEPLYEYFGGVPNYSPYPYQPYEQYGQAQYPPYNPMEEAPPPQLLAPPAPGPLDRPSDHDESAGVPLSAHQIPKPRLPKPPGAGRRLLTKPVSEKPQDKSSLAEKLSNDFEFVEPAPTYADGPVSAAAPVPSTGRPTITEDRTDDNEAVRYHVNVGGVQKGGNGGTTNFHVFSDENGDKMFSNEMDEETERYITENMIPKLGGKRKGKSTPGVWSVFGDN